MMASQESVQHRPGTYLLYSTAPERHILGQAAREISRLQTAKHNTRSRDSHPPRVHQQCNPTSPITFGTFRNCWRDTLEFMQNEDNPQPQPQPPQPQPAPAPQPQRM